MGVGLSGLGELGFGASGMVVRLGCVHWRLLRRGAIRMLMCGGIWGLLGLSLPSIRGLQVGWYVHDWAKFVDV